MSHADPERVPGAGPECAPGARPESCPVCRDQGEVGVVLPGLPGAGARGAPTGRPDGGGDHPAVHAAWASGTVAVRTPGGVVEAATDLVEGVSPGDRVLVHLGFILAVVEEAP